MYIYACFVIYLFVYFHGLDVEVRRKFDRVHSLLPLCGPREPDLAGHTPDTGHLASLDQDI